MRNKLTSILLIFLIVIASCSDGELKKQIPDDAFPIVYRGHLYVKGEANSCKGNFVFDTGASGLYFDTTFYSNNHFNYSKIVDAKIPGAGTSLQDIIVIRDTVDFSFGSDYSKLIVVGELINL